jgi:hypothetical protein
MRSCFPLCFRCFCAAFALRTRCVRAACALRSRSICATFALCFFNFIPPFPHCFRFFALSHLRDRASFALHLRCNRAMVALHWRCIWCRVCAAVALHVPTLLCFTPLILLLSLSCFALFRHFLLYFSYVVFHSTLCMSRSALFLILYISCYTLFTMIRSFPFFRCFSRSAHSFITLCLSLFVFHITLAHASFPVLCSVFKLLLSYCFYFSHLFSPPLLQSPRSPSRALSQSQSQSQSPSESKSESKSRATSPASNPEWTCPFPILPTAPIAPPPPRAEVRFNVNGRPIHHPADADRTLEVSLIFFDCLFLLFAFFGFH